MEIENFLFKLYTLIRCLTMNTGKRMKRMNSDDPVGTLYPMDLYAYSLGLWFINFADQNFMLRFIN